MKVRYRSQEGFGDHQKELGWERPTGMCPLIASPHREYPISPPGAEWFVTGGGGLVGFSIGEAAIPGTAGAVGV